MKTIIRTCLALPVLILALTTAAHAQTGTLAMVTGAHFSVPEIDPSMTTRALVLLTGTIAVLRRHRNRKNS